MSNRSTETSPRLRARIAGLFYLLTIANGVFAEVFVRGTLIVRGDPAATATNILAHEQLYRFGLAADLIMLACYIVVTLLLYGLFKPVRRSLSRLAVFFSLVGIAVLAVNSLTHLGPLIFLGGADFLGAFETAQLQTAALLSLKVHSMGYTISGVFFGIYCILIGYLTFRAGFLPRVLGALMGIGGLAYLLNSFTVFLSPSLAARLPDVTILGGIAEISFTLWLIAMGVNAAKWSERASA